jgi:hypothetical protein
MMGFGWKESARKDMPIQDKPLSTNAAAYTWLSLRSPTNFAPPSPEDEDSIWTVAICAALLRIVFLSARPAIAGLASGVREGDKAPSAARELVCK